MLSRDDDGWFDMRLSGLYISVDINIKNDGMGHPVISIADCGASINEVGVWIYGDLR